MSDILAVSRKGILSSLLLSVTILILGAFLLQVRQGIPALTYIMLLGPLFIVVWLPALRLLASGVAVELTEAGLIDHTAGLGFIAWSEVVSTGRKKFWFGDYVELELKDPKAFLRRLPWLRAQIWRINLRSRFRGPAITANWVEGGAEAVLARVRSDVSRAEDIQRLEVRAGANR